MRDIEFRGKRKDDNEWVYGYLYKINNEFKIEDNYFSHFVDINTVGQFIGLIDKNGTKVFEGDVIKSFYIDNKELIVKFDEERVGYYPFACGDGCGCCEYCTIPTENFEVIGNIHEVK